MEIDPIMQKQRDECIMLISATCDLQPLKIHKWRDGALLLLERERLPKVGQSLTVNVDPIQYTTTKESLVKIHKWRDGAQRETAQSWEMKKVRSMLIRSNLEPLKNL